jgi:hypothetical protein
LLLVNNPRSDLLQQHEKEFTAMTGMELSSESVPEQQQRQMLIVLGGLAGLPTDPYDSALIDGASSWQ